MSRLREFLREHAFEEFADGADFAGQLMGELERTWGNGWAAPRATAAINSTTASIYKWYRLRDVSVFGGDSPVQLRFGGPDKASIRFIGKLDHFYFSKFADNTRDQMRQFFAKRFFENGALFFDENSSAWRDFQKAAGDRFKNLTFRQIKTVIETATARTRVWAHIASLGQAELKWAKLIATLDAHTTPLCEFLDQKLIRVGTAQDTIERLVKLKPAEFEKALYKSDLSKGIAKNPVDTLKRYLENDEGQADGEGRIISDELVATGRGFPPFHPNCRTRAEGLIPGVHDAEIPREDASED